MGHIGALGQLISFSQLLMQDICTLWICVLYGGLFLMCLKIPRAEQYIYVCVITLIFLDAPACKPLSTICIKKWKSCKTTLSKEKPLLVSGILQKQSLLKNLSSSRSLNQQLWKNVAISSVLAGFGLVEAKSLNGKSLSRYGYDICLYTRVVVQWI